MRWIWVLGMLVALPVLNLSAGETDQLEADKKALSALHEMIGTWKGGGRPAKGDTWGEEYAWAWAFKDGRAVLSLTAAQAKYFTAATIAPGDGPNKFRLTGTKAGGGEAVYTGEINKFKDLELTTDQAGEEEPARITISLIAKGKRMTVLYERKQGERFAKLSEVGATKEGSNFGKDVNGPECVITGGLGTIAVQYQGKTYYVCCGGCKQAFDDNPAKELAAYEKRKAEAKK
ncbi:MAG: hypothetical protein M5U26_20495 [Planctomycetota bacterium]|nr:hypothetical protein [Planctomycetota bacterium]